MKNYQKLVYATTNMMKGIKDRGAHFSYVPYIKKSQFLQKRFLTILYFI